MVTRDSRILDALDQHGSVLVSDLARELGVSEVTIRKDLDALAERELLRRTRGGALPPERRDEGAFAERGLLELATDEAVSKQALVAASDEVHALFDSSKVSGFALHSFAPADRVTSLITDDGASDDFVEQWEAVGVAVARVPLLDAQTTGTASVPARAGRASRRLTQKEHR